MAPVLTPGILEKTLKEGACTRGLGRDEEDDEGD